MGLTDKQIERMGEAWPRLADGLFDFLADTDMPNETLADLDLAIRACRLLAESDEWTSEGERYAVVPILADTEPGDTEGAEG